jgi:hypothetical protein
MLPPHPDPIPPGRWETAHTSGLDIHSRIQYLSTAGSYVPDLNATDYAVFTLAPTTEMGMFTNLTLLRHRMLLKYVPFLHLPRFFEFTGCDPKLSSMRVPRSPR